MLAEPYFMGKGERKGGVGATEEFSGCGAVFHCNIFNSDGLANRIQSVSRCYLCHCFQFHDSPRPF